MFKSRSNNTPIIFFKNISIIKPVYQNSWACVLKLELKIEFSLVNNCQYLTLDCYQYSKLDTADTEDPLGLSGRKKPP